MLPKPDELPAPSPKAQADWDAFRRRFIEADGRVVDRFNQGASHTESQGWGMLFAVAFDDRESFEKIWSWTAKHLRRSSDALFSWRYLPGVKHPVSDVNNATDGDIYIAAALLRAAKRWHSEDYFDASARISRDILTLLVTDVGGRTVLLPAVSGFQFSDHVDLNLSYYVFPLLSELNQSYPSPIWTKLIADGRKLVAEAKFGRWGLPPDWLRLSTRDGSLSLADRKPPRFSFDAVRVPLFASWDRANPEALRRFADFWAAYAGGAPAWVDLKTDACAPYKACNGVVAIAMLATRESAVQAATGLPSVTADDDYYSSGLILLTHMATREIGLSDA